MPRDKFVLQHFGSMDTYLRTLDEIAAAAAAEGMVFHPALITWQPNTLDCRRFVYWAGEVGRRLLRRGCGTTADCSGGRQLIRCNVFVDVAAECGLDRAHVRRCLESDLDEGTVKALARGAINTANNGVPAYIYNKRFAAVGAQDPAYPARFTQVAWTDLNALPEATF